MYNFNEIDNRFQQEEKMKKLLLPLIALVLLLAACGNNSGNGSKESDKKAETKSYKTDDGKKIDIPKNPKRIAVVAPS